jgi:hypothetical protein
MNTKPKLLLLFALLGAGSFLGYILLQPSGIGPAVREDPSGVASSYSKAPRELVARSTPDQSGLDPVVRAPLDGNPLSGEDSKQGVTGRLVSQSGVPVAGALLYLLPAPTDKTALRMLTQHQQGVLVPPIAKATSSVDGSFALGVRKWREGDKYVVCITHPDFCDHRLPNIASQPNDWWDCGNVTLGTGATVFGCVTNEDGLPVSGATVLIVDGSGMAGFPPTPGRERGLLTQTDPSGNYEIRIVTPDRLFAISAEAENYAMRQTNDFRLAASVRHEADFQLVPGVEVAGTVIDPEGKALQGAAVTLAAMTVKADVKDKRFTDKDGGFFVSNLRPGPYSVTIEAEGYVKFEAKPIHVPVKDLEFTLERQGGIQITVLGKNNRPLSKYHVNIKVAFPGQAVFGKVVSSTEIGRAKAGSAMVGGVDPGTYVAEVFAKGHAKGFSERFTMAEGKTGFPQLTVKLNTGGSIVGTVSDTDGNPLPGVTLTTRPSGMIDNPLLAILQAPSTITRREGKTGEGGGFRLGLLNPGKYQLKITSEEHCAAYVHGIDVVLGQESEVHDIVMLRGCVVSGIAKVNGVATAQVAVSVNSIANRDNLAPFSAEAVSDNEGRFLLTKRLRPGKYEVSVAEQVQGNPLLKILQLSKSKREFVIPTGAEHHVLEVNLSKEK